MIEEVVDIHTGDGAMNTYVYRPDEGEPHPLVIFLMDSAGVREALADMCRRLATSGYCVVMPNLYYREVRHLDIQVDRLGDPAYGEQAALMWRLNRSTRIAGVMMDVGALQRHFAAVPFAGTGAIGVIGYCMSGRFALAAAGRHAERVKAAACIYGVDYFTEDPDSAHLAVPGIRGEVYVAMAEHDAYVAPGTRERLLATFESARIRHRVELFPGVEHGFALPGRRAYHKPSAERHWERIVSLFRRQLQAA